MLCYDRLLLATGSSARRLPVPGADGGNVHTLRTVEDSDRLRAAFAAAERVAVVGAGWIGPETAAAARNAGAQVAVIESRAAPLEAALGSPVSEVFTALHREHGVEFTFNARVDAITEGGVLFDDGVHVRADAVVVGIGATPNVDLARDAGLAVKDGVTVGADLRTSDPRIFAVGDIANAFHPVLGRHVRVEHWANALNQPAVAARAMLGRPAAYDDLPYFFTDQYDLGMEYVGLPHPARDTRVVVRGDLGAREFIAFWVQDDLVTAAMNVDIWDVADHTRAIIRAQRPFADADLADPNVPLAELAMA
ncbi:NAD(P)/FAD-dependent oxidoreductase [Actinomadura gamaensis]|uniref:NAD(P)/FAD-dependent oxidoreductase n=1 Tax=Actinomadura gamaensis TaxID=1763541 RepID=A0ABV9TW57_9ACTN